MLGLAGPRDYDARRVEPRSLVQGHAPCIFPEVGLATTRRHFSCKAVNGGFLCLLAVIPPRGSHSTYVQ